MTVSPERESVSTNSIFVAVEKARAWFCSPSRGATSTMRTASGSAGVTIVSPGRFGVDDPSLQVLLDQCGIAFRGREVPTAARQIERDAHFRIEPQRALAFDRAAVGKAQSAGSARRIRRRNLAPGDAAGRTVPRMSRSDSCARPVAVAGRTHPGTCPRRPSFRESSVRKPQRAKAARSPRRERQRFRSGTR